MAISDPISDMLTRIRNAAAVSKNKVIIPASKLKIEILKVLTKEGYLSGFTLENDSIILSLENSSISKLIRVSRPGRRVYAGKDLIPVVLQGHGMVVISTPKGLMTGREAKKAGLGGEVLCKVW